MRVKVQVRRPSPAMVVALLALFTALGGVAGAAFVGSGGVVKACVSKDGELRLVDETATECRGSQTLVSLAGVDGAGRVADAANADALDALDSTAFLRSDAEAGGDLTGNYPNPQIGTGKVTTGNVFDGTIGAIDLAAGAVTTEKFDAAAKAPNADKLDGKDSTDLQSRVSQGCDAGSAIRSIAGDGGVVCESDDGGTTYSAGNGLELDGTTFSTDPAKTQTRVAQACPEGWAIREIREHGTVACEKDAGHVWSVQSAGETVPEGFVGFDRATCPFGSFPTGGGVDMGQDLQGGRIIDSFPVILDDQLGWQGVVVNEDSADDQSITFTVYVICAEGGG